MRTRGKAMPRPREQDFYFVRKRYEIFTVIKRLLAKQGRRSDSGS